MPTKSSKGGLCGAKCSLRSMAIAGLFEDETEAVRRLRLPLASADDELIAAAARKNIETLGL